MLHGEVYYVHEIGVNSDHADHSKNYLILTSFIYLHFLYI